MNNEDLYLEQTTAEDYEDYYLIRCSPADIYWNGYEKEPDKEEFKKLYLKRLSSSPFDNNEDRRLYFINVNSCRIGFVQLIKHSDCVEIGYTIIEAFQKHGYATYALQQAITLAKEFNNTICVRIRDDNYASQKVALKNGFCTTSEYTQKEYPHCGIVKLRKYIKNIC